jgi:uncharacterized membrane protein
LTTGPLTTPRQEENARRTEPDSDHLLLVLQAELLISHVLRGGVVLGAIVIGVGLVAFYARYGLNPSAMIANVYPHSLDQTLLGLAHGTPQAIMVLGLLILLATPVVRVAVSIVAFALERDWTYVAITALVLLILLVSFLLGRAGA